MLSISHVSWQVTKREMNALIRLVDSDYSDSISLNEFALLLSGKDVFQAVNTNLSHSDVVVTVGGDELKGSD